MTRFGVVNLSRCQLGVTPRPEAARKKRERGEEKKNALNDHPIIGNRTNLLGRSLVAGLTGTRGSDIELGRPFATAI